MFASRELSSGWQVLGADRDGHAPLPYRVMRDEKLSRDAAFTYAVLQSHWWQPESNGECNVSQAVLMAEVRCKERMLRVYLKELLDRGHITARRVGLGQAKAYRPTYSATANDGRSATGATPPVAAVTPLGNRRDTAGRPAADRRFKRRETAGVNKTYPEDRIKTPEPVASQPGAPPTKPKAEAAKTTAKTTTAKPKPKPVLAVPKPKPPKAMPDPERTDQRLSRLIDLIRAEGLKVNVTSRDGAALKSCDAEPEDVAACFAAVAKGEFGTDWLQSNLSICNVLVHGLNRWLNRGVAQAGRWRGDPRIATGWPGAPVSAAAHNAMLDPSWDITTWEAPSS